MFKNWKTIWIVLTIIILLSTSVYAGSKKGAPEPRPPEVPKLNPPQLKDLPNSWVIAEYEVTPGDSLSLIATKLQTTLGLTITWQELYDLNRDQITDPNLIYPGQRLKVRKPYIPPITRDEKVEKLARFMFKKSRIAYVDMNDASNNLLSLQRDLARSKLSNMPEQRKLASYLSDATRQYEIWQLSEAIVDLAPNDEIFYALVGLAWQESHFKNRKGGHREVSFFQFYPPTVRHRFGLDDVGLVNALWELTNDPHKATELAIDMIIEYKSNWKRWNVGVDYTRQINDKIERFKREWNRR